MQSEIDLGIMCSIYTVTSGEWSIAPEDFDRIDAIWSAYVDGGCIRNEIIHCTQPSGGIFTLLVSEIRAMHHTTRESRMLARERHLAAQREERTDGIIDSNG